MLSNFKELVKENESDILLTITIILVALISFGTGLLVDFSENKSPIIIQNPTPNTINSSEIENKEGTFVGSVNSNKYHWPNCSSVKRIAEQNKIWFSSEEEAKNAGYTRCGNFEKYAP